MAAGRVEGHVCLFLKSCPYSAGSSSLPRVQWVGAVEELYSLFLAFPLPRQLKPCSALGSF